MKQAILATMALVIAACTAAQSQPVTAQPAEPPVARPPVIAIPVPAPPPPQAQIPPAPTTVTLSCAGSYVQGGIALCRTLPGARLFVDGTERSRADANGWVVLGFDRFATGDTRVEVRSGSNSALQLIPVSARTFGEQRVNGLPQQTVTPTEPAVLARIARERELKAHGTSSRADIEGWLDGFVIPTTGRQSSSWGNRRILNGVPNTPHYGVDIAAPDGTPIRAPAGGVVSLAEPDMHYEGGLIFIDHGQGLISMYLHMSRLDVRVGDRVTQGQVIGAVGHEGRATGPHLCWRLRWRDRNLDPSVAITGLQTARAELANMTVAAR